MDELFCSQTLQKINTLKMSDHNPNRKMEWAILIISACILIVTIISSFFRPTDTQPAYYLFGTVAGLVFGATVIKKFK